MEEYDNFGSVEKIENYDDPELALQTDDKLENNIHGNAFTKLDEKGTDALAAISKNLSPETVQREKTQKKAFLDKFNGDGPKLQAEMNKLNKGEPTIFSPEDIANLQKLSKLSKLEHRDNHSPETMNHGKIKIAKLASNTARTTKVEYGGALLSMEVDAEGKTKMTDLLNNDTALQNKLD